MKLSEMTREVKEKLYGAIGRNRKEENGQELAEALAPVIRDIVELLQTIGKTEAQIRKERLWKRYYWEKAKMSNNERRRRGIPMVRRPKRQQYRTKKCKNEKSESESPETDQEEESGQQDDGK